MKRRSFFLGAAAFFPLSRYADAQQPATLRRVGFLASGVRPSDGAPPLALRRGLASLGFPEGSALAFEGRWSGGQNDLLPSLAAELVSRDVDVILAFGSPAVEAAKRATSSVPIVVFNAGDLVETGVVASLGRPGGNVTGVNDPATALTSKRLEIVKELVPSATRVAVLWNAENRAMTLRYHGIETAARAKGMAIDPIGVRNGGDFDAALAAMTRVRPDAMMMLTDAFTNSNRQRVLDYVAAQRIPAMYEFGDVVRAGGLISYGSDQAEIFALAADCVARILRGAKAGDLPVQQPNRYYLLINLAAARKISLAVPQSLQVRADEVIQ